MAFPTNSFLRVPSQPHPSVKQPTSKDILLQRGASCAWALMAAIKRMDDCDIVLSQPDADFVHHHIMAALSHWQALYQSCQSANVKRWKMRPKHHYLEKIGDFVKRTRFNGRHMSCFQDESYLGFLKHVATKCHSTTVLTLVFQRILLNLSQRFKNSKEMRLPLGHPKRSAKKRKVFSDFPLQQ